MLQNFKKISKKINKTGPQNNLILSAMRKGTRKKQINSKVFDLNKIEEESKELGILCQDLDEAANLVNLYKRSLIREETASYYKQGLLLAQIKHKKLYKSKYKTFKKFVDQELEITVAYAYELIKITNLINWEDASKIGNRVKLVKHICRNEIKEDIRKIAIKKAQELIGKNKKDSYIIKTLDSDIFNRDFEDKITKESLLEKKAPPKIEIIQEEREDFIDELTELGIQEIQWLNENGDKIDYLEDFNKSDKLTFIKKLSDNLKLVIIVLIDRSVKPSLIRAFMRFSRISTEED